MRRSAETPLRLANVPSPWGAGKGQGGRIRFPRRADEVPDEIQVGNQLWRMTVWSSAVPRRHVAQFQSADMSAHSKKSG